MLWTQKPVDARLAAFTVKNGHELDGILLPYDVTGTRAHLVALEKAGILSPAEALQINGALDEILQRHSQGAFAIKQSQEDSHTAIEEYVTQQLGPVGEKMHAGRSRNDQSLTALRLYAKAQLAQTKAAALALKQTLAQKAAQNNHPMPGYTHMQKAMPFSTGAWLDAFAQSLHDDATCLDAAIALNDQSPLGSGAGYGSGFVLDRKAEANTLGFSRVQENPLYCQNSRGKI
ncbi:MAG: lyase family protein, partial [Candidatus Micrarchaeota archaeon]|nr:lyase family protein [Candidatus Micrarchaeota archaeon]